MVVVVLRREAVGGRRVVREKVIPVVEWRGSEERGGAVVVVARSWG